MSAAKKSVCREEELHRQAQDHSSQTGGQEERSSQDHSEEDRRT
jgi:hypothetical protein